MTDPAGWLPWFSRQLDRIEQNIDELTDLLELTHRIDRRTKRMSAQESALNEALVAFFAAISDGLARIEAKLAEAAPQVDLTDEVAAINAAKDAFSARVDADVNPAPVDPPADPPPTP